MTTNIVKSSAVSTDTTLLNVTATKANSQQATTLTYDFKVNITCGPLADQEFQGSFCYNTATLTGIGSEELGVPQGLLISFEFLGVIYTEADDFDAPLYPRVLFENGSLAGLDFEAFNNQINYQIIRDFDNNSSFFTYLIEENEITKTGSGSVTYCLREDAPASVQELGKVRELIPNWVLS
jgi:hypothetical protein